MNNEELRHEEESRLASGCDAGLAGEGHAKQSETKLYILEMPQDLMDEVDRYAKRCGDTRERLVSLAVSQWLEEPFMPRDHEVGVALRIDGYERTVLHNKASALGLTFGEYVQALVRALSVIARDGFDNYPETANEFDQAFEDGWDTDQFFAVRNEGDRQAAARELVRLLCDPRGERTGDPSEPTAMLESLLGRVEPEYDYVKCHQSPTSIYELAGATWRLGRHNPVPGARGPICRAYHGHISCLTTHGTSCGMKAVTVWALVT